MDLESAVSEQLGDRAELIVVESLSQARAATDKPVSCALLDIDVVGGKTFGIAASLRAKPFSTGEIVRFVCNAVKVV
jgi:hypothetical protein